MLVTATELNRHPGAYLDKAAREPVIIKKLGRPSVVMVDYDYYLKLEDGYWGEKAIKADAEQSLGLEKTMEFLTGDS
jgi:prevent-host-death family protein